MPARLPFRGAPARGVLNWIESGTMCMTCYDRCPLRGEGMVLDMGYIPTVGTACVGCGMCEYVCPKNAVAVVPDARKTGTGETQ